MINFSTIQTTNLIGQVIGLPTTLCGINGKAAQTFIDWSLYDGAQLAGSLGVNVDMTGIAPSVQLDVIRSVYIDNLNNPNDVYVYFRDTKFTAPCARYTAAWVPIVTNLRQATIYGINFQSLPLLAVTFTNIFVPYAVQQLTAPGGVFPASINYVGNNIGSGSTALTFNAVPLGTPATQRRIILAVSGQGQNRGLSGPTVYSINSVSYDIGGGPQPATLLGTNDSGTLVQSRLAIFREDVSLNANITVGVSSSNPGSIGFTNSMLDVFQLLGTNTATPTEYVEAADTTSLVNLTLDIPENGCGLFYAVAGSQNSINTPTPLIQNFTPVPQASNNSINVPGTIAYSLRGVSGIQDTEEAGLIQSMQFSGTGANTPNSQFRACAFAPPS